MAFAKLERKITQLEGGGVRRDPNPVNPNPVTALELDFKTVVSYDGLNSSQKGLLQGLVRATDEFKRLYESPEWKLMTQVDTFEVYRISMKKENHNVLMSRGEIDYGADDLSSIL